MPKLNCVISSKELKKLENWYATKIAAKYGCSAVHIRALRVRLKKGESWS